LGLIENWEKSLMYKINSRVEKWSKVGD